MSPFGPGERCAIEWLEWGRNGHRGFRTVHIHITPSNRARDALGPANRLSALRRPLMAGVEAVGKPHFALESADQS